MSTTSCQINYRANEGGFVTEFPALLQNSTITQDEFKNTLERVSDEFLDIFDNIASLKRWSRFGLLIFSFVFTSICGIGLWLTVFLYYGLEWFFILFLSFVLGETLVLLFVLYILNSFIGKLASAQYQKLKDSLDIESQTKYEARGVKMSLKYLTESVDIMPSIKLELLDAFDPKSAWHKYPTIIIGKQIEFRNKTNYEKEGNSMDTYAILEDV
jgi:hypothetical protein